MVSFGLAFGKGIVSGLGKQQERKWAKEAYEDSPEFQKYMLDIEAAKENIKETGLDIQIKQKELADYGVDYKVGGFNFSLAGSGVKDPTQLAYLKLSKINDHFMNNTDGFRDAVLSNDGNNTTARALDGEFSYILPVVKKHIDPDNKGIFPARENIPQMFENDKFFTRFYKNLVDNRILKACMMKLEERQDGTVLQKEVKTGPNKQKLNYGRKT